MVATKDINEVDLLYNLQNRLSQEKTFTNVGPTLIIVNPFKDIKNIYCHEKIEYYIEKQEQENPELREKISEPHLYDLVLIAIREILKPNPKNQALVISGESGAGKTVATKNAMECITYFFAKFNKNLEKNNVNNSNSINKETPLEKKILDCNPILEGFGNAKTLRNDNSSRFGKYVKIKFNNESNVIEGAEMYTYLLEKSRITELNPKERNFHIFYFLLKGAEDSFLNELYLQRDFRNYSYLWHNPNGAQVTEVPSINDKECYQEVIDCFKSTNFSQEEITQIFKVISAVLLIGNLKFKISMDALESLEVPYYSYTISNVQSIHNIIIVSELIPSYTINVSCGPMGTINPSGAITVKEGGSLTITGTPETNYLVDKVFLNSISTSFSGNSFTLSNVQNDANIYFLFSTGSTTFYEKNNNGNWVQVVQAYKKENGRWIEYEFALIGDPNAKYVRLEV